MSPVKKVPQQHWVYDSTIEWKDGGIGRRQKAYARIRLISIL